jgi:8-oxo-dGTP pyrophosphatase MutT (NUDIX family)
MKQRLKQILSQRQKQYIVDTRRIPAAVIVPLFIKNGECHILFTKRTEEVKSHKGQISFPGGTYDKRDKTLLNTALRESFEEVGLMADDIEILGELDDYPSVTSNFIITPFVGFIPWPYQFKIDSREVEEIIEAPVAVFMDDSNLHLETEIWGKERNIVYFYHYKDRIIWGATARILSRFLGILASITPGK